MRQNLDNLEVVCFLSLVDIPPQRCVQTTRLRGNAANYSANATARGSNSRTQMMTRLRSHSSHVPFTTASGAASFAAYSVMPYSRPIYLLPAHQSTADVLPVRAIPGTITTRGGRTSAARGSRANRNTGILPPTS